jgi:transposase-like protein
MAGFPIPPGPLPTCSKSIFKIDDKGNPVEGIMEALWGSRVSASTVSELNQKVYGQIEAWRNKPIEGEHPYLYLDGIWLKRTCGGEVRKVALLVAISVNADG